MLAMMEAHQAASTSSNTSAPPSTPDSNNAHSQEFLTSGRTGRRNALPDILGITSKTDLRNFSLIIGICFV